jgi:ATP-binding cassette subfamily C protein
LLGLLAPTSGTITYSGVPIGLANPNWFGHVGYVPQETFILDGSVLSNVALGDAMPSTDRVWSALDQYMLGDVIRRMPDGLNTRLGEAGSRLSVGQRQRLGIARALYRRPAILILDEPTAALDQATEADVMRTIGALKGSLTIVMVTHRLKAATDADAVMQLSLDRPGLVANGDELVPEPLRGSV